MGVIAVMDAVLVRGVWGSVVSQDGEGSCFGSRQGSCAVLPTTTGIKSSCACRLAKDSLRGLPAGKIILLAIQAHFVAHSGQIRFTRVLKTLCV